MNQHDTHKPTTTQKIVSQSAQPALEEAPAEPQAVDAAVDRADPRQTPYSAGQQALMLQRMQRTVGNAQVQRMLSQRSTAPSQRATPPVAAAPTLSVSQAGPAPAAAAPEQPETASAPVTVQRAPSSSPLIAKMTPAAQPAALIARAGSGRGMSLRDRWNQGVNALAEGGRQLALRAFAAAARRAGINPGPIIALINRAGNLAGQVIQNPTRFANTLVRGVGQGFRQFQSNISRHLQSGFGAWLFGTMGGAGIRMPRDLSPPSVLSLVLQVLGVTPNNLRQRVAAQVGARNVQGVEQAWGTIGTAIRGGLGGLWTLLREELGDLRAQVVDGIKDWLISSVVRAAVTRIVSMFNPASGIVMAIASIANVIRFVVQRAGQIRALFQSVTDSVSALAQGNAQQLASKVEQTLGRAVPVAIGLFSSLVGIGGIANRVKAIIQRVQSRVQSAIDRLIRRVVERARSLLSRGGATSAPGQAGPRQAAPNAQAAQHDPRLRAGIAMIHARERALAGGGGLTSREAESIASDARQQHPVFKTLTARNAGRTWNYHYTVARNVVQGTVPATHNQPSMTQVSVIFKCNVSRANHSPTEFARQLQMQETAINNMTVAAWIQGRDQFVQRRTTSGEGRHPDSARAQEQYRQQERVRWIATRIQQLKRQNPSLTTPQARVLANNDWNRQDALHQIDQVAGGDHLDLDGFGDSSVNRSIGAQWAGNEVSGTRLSRVQKIYLEALKVPQADRAVCKMNVQLTMTRV